MRNETRMLRFLHGQNNLIVTKRTEAKGAGQPRVGAQEGLGESMPKLGRSELNANLTYRAFFRD